MATLAIGAVVKQSFGLLGQLPLLLLGVAFALVGLPEIVTQWAFDPGNPKGLAAAAGDRPAAFVQMAAQLIVALLFIWAQALLILICFQHLTMGRVSLNDCFNISAQKLPKVIALTALFALIGGGTLLGIVFGLIHLIGGDLMDWDRGEIANGGLALGLVAMILVATWAFLTVMVAAMPAIITGQTGVFGAIAHSWALTKGARTRIAVCLGLFGMMVVIIAGIVITMTAILGSADSGIFGNAASTSGIPSQTGFFPLLVTAILSTAITAFGAAMVASIYVNLRSGMVGQPVDALSDIFA